MNQELTPLQRDAITELLNIGVGRAAAALSEMVDQEVGLSVPNLDFIARSQMPELLGEDFGDRITLLKQHFAGAFWGDALLIFPEDRSMDLVREVMGTLALDSMGELEQEALTEVGNVILNACIGGLANAFGVETECALPDFIQSETNVIFAPPDEGEEPVVMVLRMVFTIEERDIKGYLAFVLDGSALSTFLGHVERFLTGGGVVE
ncbi:MAG: chemotaxis protein CheC [Myxococcota bacterium]|nr:chemotaxis protein CheC [Myxococcota bacterium]